MLRALSAVRHCRLARPPSPRISTALWQPRRYLAVPSSLPAAQEATPPEIQSHSAHEHAVISTFDLFSIGTSIQSHMIQMCIDIDSCLNRHWTVEQSYSRPSTRCRYLYWRAGESKYSGQGSSPESQPLWKSGCYWSRAYDSGSSDDGNTLLSE